MKIGILQAGHSPPELAKEFGDYDKFFRRFLGGNGFEFVTYPVVDDVFPSSIDEADGWLVTGSKFGVYEGHAWIATLEDFLRESFAAEKPIVGICFGHQILAQALGGKVEKFDGGWSVGVESYQFEGRSEDVKPCWPGIRTRWFNRLLRRVWSAVLIFVPMLHSPTANRLLRYNRTPNLKQNLLPSSSMPDGIY